MKVSAILSGIYLFDLIKSWNLAKCAKTLGGIPFTIALKFPLSIEILVLNPLIFASWIIKSLLNASAPEILKILCSPFNVSFLKLKGPSALV